ncbi:hypothetical protein ABVK25_008544 [Lepraria finkii]|uniref:Uncharacterized protein n=1 Tax=Lepraria finkii TaxID=1340010 RepID=A0ABR4B056_9LECA
MDSNERTFDYSYHINYYIIICIALYAVYFIAKLVFDEARRIEDLLRDQEEGTTTTELQCLLMHTENKNSYGLFGLNFSQK